MRLQESTVLIYIWSSFIFGICIFLHGFFPLSFSTNTRSSSEDLPRTLNNISLNYSAYLQAKYNETVLLVIDALKADFVYKADDMAYTKQLISEGRACSFNIKVQPPTVTAPRINALTTGTIPSFMDAVLNLGSFKVHTDSIIYQMHKTGGRIAYLGDNTFPDMFPNLFSTKHVTTNKFFITDFHGADRNVTSWLSDILKFPKWNMLIVYYLGLDNIGHVEGPFSTTINKKLVEMDEVVRKIDKTLVQQSEKSPLLFITGDHGMRDSGGHGGSTYPEIHVPLVIVGCKCDDNSLPEVYEQTDIASTMSVLLGLPIPASCIGTIIPELIKAFPKIEQLYILYYNSHRLYNKVLENFKYDDNLLQDSQFHIQFNEAKRLHTNFLTNKLNNSEFKMAKLYYVSSSREMSNMLIRTFIKYDLFSIFFGIMISVCTFLTFIITLLLRKSTKGDLIIHMKFKDFFFTIIIGLIIKEILCKLYSYDNNNYYLCNLNKIAFTIIITLIFLINIKCIYLYYNEFFYLLMALIKDYKQWSKVIFFIIFIIIFHTISFISTSYIEEEHQTWYYVLNTLFVIIFIKELINTFSIDNNNFNNRRIVIKITDNWLNLLKIILLLCGHVIVRRFNQTGDKWLSIPDIGDWFLENNNKFYLSLLTIINLIILLIILINYNKNSFLINILIFTTILLIYYFRTINGDLLLLNEDKKSSKSNLSFYLFWANIIEIIFINLIINIKYKFYKKYNIIKILLNELFNIIVITLITTMLHKPHNIIINVLCLITCKYIDNIIKHCFITNNNFNTNDNNNKLNEIIFIKIILLIWLGKLFYFYQGNSNSLASIDLNAGFIGLNDFYIIIVIIFTILNTYSTLFIIYTFILNYIINDNNYLFIIKIITFITLLPIIIYLFILTIFRNHIFVWTVFSPKIIYESFYLCLMYLFILSIIIIKK